MICSLRSVPSLHSILLCSCGRFGGVNNSFEHGRLPSSVGQKEKALFYPFPTTDIEMASRSYQHLGNGLELVGPSPVGLQLPSPPPTEIHLHVHAIHLELHVARVSKSTPSTAQPYECLTMSSLENAGPVGGDSSSQGQQEPSKAKR